MSTSITDGILRILKLVQEQILPISRITSIATVGLSISGAFSHLLDRLVVSLDRIPAMAFPDANFQPLAFLNFIFPFEQFIAFLSGYLVLLLACATIRIIKSFIPEISG